MRLNKNFFKKPTVEVAKKLLGCYLIKGKCVGKIIETEAYLANDPASHSFRGKTSRNEQMFEEAGKAYVYFTYGMHYCFNVVTAPKGVGEAVLIRAVEPIRGLNLMKKRRKIYDEKSLCNGPAKITKAFGINLKDNGKILTKGKLRIEAGKLKNREKIIECERIGISKGKELKLRFIISPRKN